jgi:cytochrome c oxidase subunit 3
VVEQNSSHSADAGPQALPVSNGKLAMWLFLSTEVMFFAALIGSYIVLRWSAPGGQWPDQHSVHVQPVLGVVNTLILIASSLAMARAAALLRLGASGTCRIWLLVAFLLGLSFLGIKSIEYNEKFKLGLLPGGNPSLLHDQADVYYLGHLKSVLGTAVGAPASTEERTDSPAGNRKLSESSGKADWRRAMLIGGINWTEEQLGRGADEARQSELLSWLAEAVYPLHEGSERQDGARKEQAELTGVISELRQQQKFAEQRLGELQAQLAKEQKLLAEAAEADKPAWAASLEKVKTEAAALTADLTKWKAAESANNSRSDFLKLIADLPTGAGLDDKLDLTLPKVIPQGRTWANTYFLLTGCHALHLIAGLVVIGGLLLTRLGVAQLGWVDNTSLYWQFVDVVWLILFPLIYFL